MLRSFISTSSCKSCNSAQPHFYLCLQINWESLAATQLWLSFWAKLPHSLRTLLLLHYYYYVRHTNSTPAQKAAALSNKMLSSEHPSSQQLSQQQQQLPTLRQQHLVARSQLLATAAASSTSAGWHNIEMFLWDGEREHTQRCAFNFCKTFSTTRPSYVQLLPHTTTTTPTHSIMKQRHTKCSYVAAAILYNPLKWLHISLVLEKKNRSTMGGG